MEQLRELRSSILVGQAAGMKSYQADAEGLSNPRDGLDVLPVFVPCAVRHDAASQANGFDGGVIFADGGEHSGNDVDLISRSESRKSAPNVRVGAEWVERQLQARDTNLLEKIH